jgi:hypothetical protein
VEKIDLKNFFIATHLCSGFDWLIESLNNVRGVKAYNTKRSYSHPEDLMNLFSKKSKSNLIGDTLLYNNALSSKSFLSFSKFIYVLRDMSAIGLMLDDDKLPYNEETATRYYCFRLRRLYDMASNTSGAVFLTWEQIRDGKWPELVQEYLELESTPRPIDKLDEIPRPVSREVKNEAEECYEKYLYKFKNLNLRSLFPAQ